MEKVLVIIGVIAVVLGVKMIYDARPIVKTYFSFGQENEAIARHKDNRICFKHCRWYFIIF